MPFTPEFKEYVESQWEEGMDWLNYTQLWTLDYITPLEEADTFEDNLELLHWSNLQPVWVDQNGDQGVDQNTK